MSLMQRQPTDRSTNQAETRRNESNALARVFAVWRTGLPRPVLVLQGGNALNYFGTGLILPFGIIYLHAVRGFSTATAGLVLATVMGTAAVVTLPSGALLDRFSAKRILIAGNVVNALGYGGLAFVDRPWQGFVCSAVGGAGFGFVGTAGQVLTLTLVPAEQRAASTALRRVAGNFGLGLGATVAGFIVAATHHHLQAFQGLYLFDAVTFVVFALVVLVRIPDPGLADAPSAGEGAQGFRAVARDRLLLALIAGNLAVVLLAVLLATLTHSTLAATTVLAGVAIVIAVAECAQFIVLGPLVAEIAPPHLLGRYMSLYQFSFMVGVALGPAVGCVLLGTSPDTIWWGGAFALALTGAGFLRLGNRIPDPLLPTNSPPLAASGAT